jgi:hypothetical protein
MRRRTERSCSSQEATSSTILFGTDARDGARSDYAPVFTNSQRYTPVPEGWVPSEHEELHKERMARRNRYHAHIDRAPTNLHRRKVADTGEGWFAVGFPDVLTSAQLEELVEK